MQHACARLLQLMWRMKDRINAWNLIRETLKESIDDSLLRLSAALSYYAVFSLAPLLLIVVSIAGLVFGDDAAAGVLSGQLTATMGQQAAETVQEMIARSREPSDNVVATVVGIAMMLLGSTGVFLQLQDALNTVWGLQAREGQGMAGMIRNRLLSFSVVLGIGFLLLISLMLGTAVHGASGWLATVAPLPPVLWSLIERLASFAVTSLLFATIFRVLPDADIAWGDVWHGAVATSLLFSVGQYGLSWYLARESTASSYGSAGALVLILLWVYYSSIILLFGAELTQVLARVRGRNIMPNERAVRVQVSVVPQPQS